MNEPTRILIVDDDPHVRKTLMDILVYKGYDPLTVAHGNDVLKAIEDKLPAVALIDLKLEDISGTEVMKLLKEHAPDIECVMVTGHASQTSAIDAINLGAFSYVQKPYDLEQLLVTIRHAIEKQTANLALKEREHDLAEAQRLAHIGSWRYNPRNEILTWSIEMFRILGLDPSLGAPSYAEHKRLVYPDELESLASATQSVLSTDPGNQLDLRITHPDSTVRDITATCKADYGPDGRVVQIIGTVQDITERKRAEDALSRRVVQLSLLNDIVTQIGTELEVNKVLERTVLLVHERFGYHHVSIFSRNEESNELMMRVKAGILASSFPIDHRVKPGQGMVGWVSEYKKSLLANDVTAESKYVNFYPDTIPTQSELSIPIQSGGTLLGVLDLQSPQRNAFDQNDVLVMETLAGQIAVALENARLYQTAQQELTERKRVEEILREHMDRLRSLHTIDQAILSAKSPSEIVNIVLGDIRQLIPCDYASIVLFGSQTKEESSFMVDANGLAVQHQKFPLMDPRWDIRLKEGKAIILDNLLVQEPEFTLLMKQNIIDKGIRSSLSMPLLAQDELLGIINLASFLPNTYNSTHVEIIQEMAVQVAIAIQQALLYEHIHQHTAELEQRVAERTEELHQANTALIRASRLKDEFLASMSHELRTPLTGVLNLSEALQEQVYGPLNEKQLQLLHTIEESGRHLLRLINDILDLSKIGAGQLELQVETCSIGNICQSSLQMIKGLAQKKLQNISFTINPATIEAQADPRRLKQMLVNLLSNAVKFTPNNGMIGLEVEGNIEAQVVRFTVWDKGIGIAAEDMPKLFRAFTQLDSSLSRQQPGTGLGLALVERMADLHGGSVSLESTLGQGSRFTIILPWKPEVPDTASPAVQKIGSGLLNKVLTVEDAGLDAAHLTRLLSELGISNIVHSHAAGVVELASQLNPDAILLDLHLPDKSGWEVLKDLKANPSTKDIPVIITSVEENPTRAAALGAVGYLVKPFTMVNLRSELERGLGRASVYSASVLMIGAAQSGPLILLAEDNEANIVTYSDYLLAKDYRVTVARNGNEATALAQEILPDLILMDIQMPGMDGLEAIRHIRGSPEACLAAIPIIALTALAMPGDRERCLAAGANEYLSKPVRLQELMHAIQSQLAKQSEGGAV